MAIFSDDERVLKKTTVNQAEFYPSEKSQSDPRA
jgi:hypothetical protein